MKLNRLSGICAVILAAAAGPLGAQVDSSRLVLDYRYVPGSQPGLVVVAAPGLDSVRKIIERDLQFSDLFTMALMSDTSGVIRGPFNPQLFALAGIAWAVEIELAPAGVHVRLFDVASGQLKGEVTRMVDRSGAGDTRLGIHGLSDQVVAWTGATGIAATRILYKMIVGNDDAIWRIDSDGANPVRVSRPGSGYHWTPAWSPDGASVAYTEAGDGAAKLVVQTLASGTRRVVPTEIPGGNAFGAEFSPDGHMLAFQQASERGTDIFAADVARMCCTHRLTTKGNLADNLSPTYSPDSRQIAFLTKRAGSTQIYVMDAEGSSPVPLVPEGGSFRPRWSPDGSRILFGRDLPGGGRQIFTYEIGSGTTKQWTSTGGYNEDASWAPDSRHIVFKSRRSGNKEQMFVMDLRSTSVRALPTPGPTSYPAWSRTLGNP